MLNSVVVVVEGGNLPAHIKIEEAKHAECPAKRTEQLDEFGADEVEGAHEFSPKTKMRSNLGRV